MLIRFDSLGDFARRCDGVSRVYRSTDNRWAGGIQRLSYDQAVNLATSGDDTLVPQAQAIIDQLDCEIDTPCGQWLSSPIGAYPIVPEALAGLPDCMRRRVEVSQDNAPVTVYVSTTCSADISAQDMLKRGVAILALVLKLQSFRPVKLVLLAETHGQSDGQCIQAIEINSQPIDLATACYALTSVAFTRHLTYSLAHEIDGFDGSWPRRYNGGGSRWEAHLRDYIGMAEQDLYIGAARSWDEALANPVAWVNAHIQRFTSSGNGDGD